MSGTRGGIGRIVAMGIGLAVALLLLLAGEARAGKYVVAQCGWYLGADADWADATGGAKFRPDGYCVPPAGADPFDGVHLKSLTRDGQGSVSGTRLARWRWIAPAGSGITQVRGTWWHALHDGIEQRLGTGNWAGGFDVFAAAAATETAPREFVAGFQPSVPTFEDRLLCARPESAWCDLGSGSWSALRALSITVQDDQSPLMALGGAIASAGWLRGDVPAVVSGSDVGAGIRFAETSVDGGTRVALTEFPCAKAQIGGEWRATAMRPCEALVGTTQWVATGRLSDGPHPLQSCVSDFSGNLGCASPGTILIDNNPPAHPRAPAPAGGDGWHRDAAFAVSWGNPDQGAASPIAGAVWRLTGPGGFDTGAQFSAGRNLSELRRLIVPRAGAYALQLWLRDEAGNEDSRSAMTVPLRFDDRPPALAFAATENAIPDRVQAGVVDADSGPAGGEISYRRIDAQAWSELPTRLLAGPEADTAQLVATVPDLAPGTYLFRAGAVDAAGNAAVSSRRADGTEMVLRRQAQAPVPRAKTRLFARLRGGRGREQALTVPFGAAVALGGRLVRGDGAGIAGREVRVVSRPSRGAVAGVDEQTATTGPRGGFQVALGPGPSRRVAAVFPGEAGLEPARRAALELRVRAGVELHARPRALRTGESLRLSGLVRGHGAPMPRRGKLVAIQYLEAATRRWRPVLVVRSDHHGRFRARYRFRYVDGLASIRLRATALAEERWPYAPGSSAPVTVRVRG